MLFKRSGGISWLVVFLGNPGTKYEMTRHNAGFMAGDAMAKAQGAAINRSRFKALTGTCDIGGETVMLMKPQTFMNLSGESLRAACDFFKVDPEEGLIVIYDDISLAPGQLRVRKKGSAGGHNGIKHIIAQLGTQNFLRVKVGVGEKPAGWDLADYVLGHFSKEEQVLMEEAFLRAADAASALLTEDVERVMNQYNTHK